MLKPRAGRQHEHCPNLSAVVHRSDGKWAWATITRLWYDGCEITSKEAFEEGEKVQIEIGSMGNIRAAVASCADGMISVRFDEECPV